MIPCWRRRFAFGLLIGCGWLAGGAALRAQETVYVLPSDLNTLLTWGAYPPTAGTTCADDAHLGGTDRLLQQVTVPVASNMQRTATMELALYARGAGGFPGSLLWSSSRDVNFAEPANGNDLIRSVLFGPVGVVVPTDLIWAVTFTNITAYDPAVPSLSFFGLIWNEADNLIPAGSAAGASNDVTTAYRRLPGFAWQATTGPTLNGVPHDAILTIGMTADPVPESGVAGMVLMGSAWRRRRRR